VSDPRRVAKDEIEPAPAKHLWEGEMPVKKVILPLEPIDLVPQITGYATALDPYKRGAPEVSLESFPIARIALDVLDWLRITPVDSGRHDLRSADDWRGRGHPEQGMS
jgi:hypothetical protein